MSVDIEYFHSQMKFMEYLLEFYTHNAGVQVVECTPETDVCNLPWVEELRSNLIKALNFDIIGSTVYDKRVPNRYNPDGEERMVILETDKPIGLDKMLLITNRFRGTYIIAVLPKTFKKFNEDGSAYFDMSTPRALADSVYLAYKAYALEVLCHGMHKDYDINQYVYETIVPMVGTLRFIHQYMAHENIQDTIKWCREDVRCASFARLLENPKKADVILHSYDRYELFGVVTDYATMYYQMKK